MIQAYLTFCKVIYDYYVRKEGADGGSKFTTFLVTTILLGANCFTLFGIYDYYFNSLSVLNKFYFFFLWAIIGLINYLLFIRREELYTEKVIGNKQKIYSLIYILFSILVLIVILKLNHDKNIVGA